jgi:hypothetical protein
MVVLALQKYIVSHSPRAKWPEEAPTRPVEGGAPISVSHVRTTTPPPLSLEKARAVSSSCAEVSEEELLEELAGLEDGAPSGTRPSTAPLPPNDFDLPFASTRPPAPLVPEVVVDPPVEARPRKWIGRVAVTIAVGVSALILGAAALARTRAHAAAALEASEVPVAHSAPVATAPSGPTAQTAQTVQAVQTAPAAPTAPTATTAPSVPPQTKASATATQKSPPAVRAKPVQHSTHKGSTRKPGAPGSSAASSASRH